MRYMLTAGCCFALGDYMGITVTYPYFVWIAGIVLSSLILLWGLSRQQGGKVLPLGFIALIICVGAVWGTKANEPLPLFWQQLYKQPGLIEGRIVPGSLERRKWQSISFIMEESYTGKGVQVLITKWPKYRALPTYGQVRMLCQLEPVKSFVNPGTMDASLQNRAHNIWARTRAVAESVQIWQEKPPMAYYFVQIVNAMQEKLEQSMSASDSSVLAGMTLGTTKHIPEDILETFAAVGIMHLLAVSGTHVALVGGSALLGTKALGISSGWCNMVAAISIIFYGLLCGGKPAVVRSVCMGLAYLGGNALNRKADKTAIFGLALFISLLYKPWWIFHRGFQLSFLATAGLIFLLPKLTAICTKGLPYKLAVGLAMPLAVQLPMLPLLLIYFHQLSPISLVTNLLVLPLLSLVLILTLAGLSLCLLIPYLGKICLVIAAQGLGLALWQVKLLQKIPGGSIALSNFTAISLLVYYLLLGTVFGLFSLAPIPKNWRKIVAISMSVFLISSQTYVETRKPLFTVYFLDVGQGDCAVIYTPQKICAVLDTGGLEEDFDTGAKIIVPVLRYLGIKSVDALIISHGHRDHAGGAAGLARLVPVKNIFLPQEPLSQEVENLLHYAPRAQVHRLSAGTKIKIRDFTLTMLTASKQDAAREATNESCGLMKVEYQGRGILFTGDANKAMELGALKAPLQADVLKIAHHGSKQSTCEKFLRKVQPRLAVISCGYKNKFGHPHKETLERLVSLGIRYYRTDVQGAIKLHIVKGKIIAVPSKEKG